MINLLGLKEDPEKDWKIHESELIIALSQADAILLVTALEAPAVSNARLKAANDRYESKLK